MKHRVLFVSELQSIHTKQVVNALVDLGHDVTVLGAERGHSPIATEGFRGARVVPLPLQSRIGYARLSRSIRALWRRERFDVCHANYVSSYGLGAALSLARPLVVSVWGSDIMEFPDRTPLHRFLVSYVLNRAAEVLATSTDMGRAASALSGTMVTHTPFGVSTELFFPKQSDGPPKERFTIGTVKGLNHVYGIDVLIRAFEIFVTRERAKSARLVIAGDGPDRDAIKRFARQSAASDQIEFHGRIPHNAVPDLIRTFDVFAALSRREGYGVAILEASACGIPVVASRVGGLPEVVSEDVTGYLVPSECPEAAADRFAALYGNVELRRELGAAGVEWVEQNFTWERTAELITSAYDRVTGHRS